MPFINRCVAKLWRSVCGVACSVPPCLSPRPGGPPSVGPDRRRDTVASYHPPGSTATLSAGKTYCQPHSRPALGYLPPKASGSGASPYPLATSTSCHSLFHQMGMQLVAQCHGQQRRPILVTLAAPHHDQPAIEVQVLHPQPQQLTEARSRKATSLSTGTVARPSKGAAAPQPRTTPSAAWVPAWRGQSVPSPPSQHAAPRGTEVAERAEGLVLRQSAHLFDHARCVRKALASAAVGSPSASVSWRYARKRRFQCR